MNDLQEKINFWVEFLYRKILEVLKNKFFYWQNVIFDFWICLFKGVLEDKGLYSSDFQCLLLYNGLDFN